MLMKKYVRPQMELVMVEFQSLMATSGGNNRIIISVDDQEQVVFGCSNQEGFGSIWD